MTPFPERASGSPNSRGGITIATLRRRAASRWAAWGLPLASILLLAAGCVGIDNPDGWAAPVQDEGAIYLNIDNGELTAVAAETYDLLWEFPAADEQECSDDGPEERDLRAIYASPAVADGIVYFGGWDGFVYALDAEIGECLWDFETNDPIIGGVVVDGDRVFAGSTDGNLYVLNATTGDEIDRVRTGEIWSTPTLAEGVLYFGTMDGAVRAIDTSTLEDVWDENASVTGGLLTDAVLANGSIIVGGIGETLYSVDAATGAVEWSFSGASNWYWGAPLVGEETGLVYATNMDGSIYAVDAASGDPIWEFSGPALFRAGAAMAGDTVVAVDDDGNVWGLDSETGELAWNGPTETNESTFASPLVLDNNTVLITPRNGDMLTVEVDTGRLTTVSIGR